MTVSILRTAVGVVDVAAVAMSVVYGLTRVGSPSDKRERRLDERRVEDLRGGIARAVDLHWTRRGSLPASLHELSDATVRDVALNDPERGEPYEYRVRAAWAFGLCGFFGTDWSDRSMEVFWTHPMGRRRDADKDGSPVIPRARR